MSDPVSMRVAAGVAHIQFDRPERMNAVDIATGHAFLACCRRAMADEGVRAVLVSGAGRVFGVGGDLSVLAGDAAAAAPGLIEPMHEALACLGEMPKPVVAAVHGLAFGGSFSVAVACDLVIAAEGTRFNLAYVNIGASCDGGASWSLPRLVGLRNALAIAMLGEDMNTADALRLGLVNEVVPAAELADKAMALACRLAAGPTQAIGRMKRLMRESHLHGLAQQLQLESEAFVANAATADFQAGLTAFSARRKPEFTGR